MYKLLSVNLIDFYVTTETTRVFRIGIVKRDHQCNSRLFAQQPIFAIRLA